MWAPLRGVSSKEYIGFERGLREGRKRLYISGFKRVIGKGNKQYIRV